jgi:hypothetical protein
LMGEKGHCLEDDAGTHTEWMGRKFL